MSFLRRLRQLQHWLTDRHHHDHPVSGHHPREGFHWDEQARRDLDTLLTTAARRNDPQGRVDGPSGLAWDDDDD